MSLFFELLSRRICGERGPMTMKQSRIIRLLSVVLLLFAFAVWLLLRPPQEALFSGNPVADGNGTGSSATALDNTRASANEDATGSASESAPSQPASVCGETAKEQLRKSGQYESLAAAFHAARFAAEKIDPAGQHSRGADYFAANPKQQLRAWFGKRGVELASGLKTQEGKEPWSVQVRLRSVARADSANLIEASENSQSASAVGSRVEITDTSAEVTQWFENRNEGIEQGFTIHKAPVGKSGSLEVLLGLDGNVHVENFAKARISGMRFVESDGTPVVSYAGLKAWDATGRELPSYMETRAGGLALLVNDTDAQYPVTVDPLFANVESRLAGSDYGGAHFGHFRF